jgi:hypothetical protein
VSSNHDLSALLLVALAFGGFIVAAGTTSETNQNQNKTQDAYDLTLGHTSFKNALTIWGVSGHLNDATIAHMAKFDLVNTDYRVTNIAELKTLNPDVVVLGYRDMCLMQDNLPDWSTVDANEDWFYHYGDGSRVIWAYGDYNNYLMNPASVGWRNHFTSVSKAAIIAAGMDGLFIDDVWDSWGMPIYGLNPPAFPVDYHDTCEAFLAYVKAQYGTMLVVGNGPNNTDYPNACDGKFAENFLTMFDAFTDIDALVTLSTATKTYVSFQRTPTQSVMTYCLAGFLLGVNGDNAYFGHGDFYDVDHPYGFGGYYEEMDTVQTIGTATGAYALSQNVYMREFTNGKVVFNPSANNYNIVLPGYKFLLGGLDATAFTLNAYTAAILVPDAEPLVYPTTAELSLSASTVEIDHPVSCTASFTGDVGTPTGTATFYVSLNEGLTWLQYGVAKTLVSGAATSIGYYPSIAGTYLFKAVYSGDANYAASSNSISFTVNNPVVATAPVSLGLLGQIITKMEAANVGDSYWDRGIWEDGMWEHDTPMIKLRKQMEKM